MGESPSADEVTDQALRHEIELLGEVIAAALQCPSHLSLTEVDDVLGVVAPRAGALPDGTLTDRGSAKGLRPAD